MSRVRMHEWLTLLWTALTVGTTAWAIWQPDNRLLLSWIVFMSGYAIVVGHWGAREGAAPSEGEQDS